MPSFFDKLVSGVNQGMNTISENSKAIIEKNKLNSQLQTENRQRGFLIKDLGEAVYALMANEGLHIEQCEELFNQIKECEKRSEDLKAQVAEVDRLKDETLEKQKAEAEARMAEADLQREQQECQPQIPAGVQCECGCVNEPHSTFCRMCGKKLDD